MSVCQRLAAILTVLSFFAGGSDAVAERKIYWTEKGPAKIRRSNLDGTQTEDVVTTGLSSPIGITVVGGHIYWTDNGTGKVERADLDGSNRITLGLGAALGVAVDPAAGKLYWSDSGRIVRADLDGQNAATFIPGLTTPWDVEIDGLGGKIYWTDVDGDSVHRANLADGSGAETLIGSALTSGPAGMDLDVVNQRVYWASQRNAPRQIQRAPLTGAVVENLVSGADPQGVALDVAAGRIYWTDQGTGQILRSSLDGTGTIEIKQGLGFPSGIDVADVSPGAGRVPDGSGASTPLTVAKVGGGEVQLSWGASCSAADTDYSVYQGALGEPGFHLPLLCSTGGATTATVTPRAGLYFSEKTPGRVRRTTLSGGAPDELVTGLAVPLTVTVAGSHVYWADKQAGTIERANLDGSGRVTLKDQLDQPLGVAVDLRAGRLYWSVAGKIQRAALDGTGAVDFILGQTAPWDIALDVAGDRIYWSESGVGVDSIRRAQLSDGSGVEVVVDSTKTSGPAGMDLDLRRRRIYWASQRDAPRAIQSANLDGTDVQLIAAVDDPQAVVVDAGAGILYWTDQAGSRIESSRLDGSLRADFLPGLAAPSGLDLDQSGTVYFLVVPHDGTREGSYGRAAAAQERATSATACSPQILAACP